MTRMGLAKVADTIVGDEKVRGRLITIILLPGQRVLAVSNPSAGARRRCL
jgi:hypothetical protein